MSGAEVLDLGRNAIWVTVLVAAGPMLVGLVVGLVVSLLQTLTQVPTLSARMAGEYRLRPARDSDHLRTGQWLQQGPRTFRSRPSQSLPPRIPRRV